MSFTDAWFNSEEIDQKPDAAPVKAALGSLTLKDVQTIGQKPTSPLGFDLSSLQIIEPEIATASPAQQTNQVGDTQTAAQAPSDIPPLKLNLPPIESFTNMFQPAEQSQPSESGEESEWQRFANMLKNIAGFQSADINTEYKPDGSVHYRAVSGDRSSCVTQVTYADGRSSQFATTLVDGKTQVNRLDPSGRILAA